MFKALKKSLGLKKRDGSSAKLQEQAAGDSASAAVAAEAASRLVLAAAPAGLPLPDQQLGAAPPVTAAGLGQYAAGGGSAAGSPVGRPATPDAPLLGAHGSDFQSVDYELMIAGHLDLDEGVPGPLHAVEAPGHSAAAPAAEGGAAAAPAAGEWPGAGPEGEEPRQQQQQELYDTADACGTPSADENDATAAAAAGAAERGDGGGSTSPGGAAAGAAEAGGRDGEGEGISDALATMMYLTEDGEGGDDCVSVVSDALSEDDLPDDISELSRALEALEGEALGSSPRGAFGMPGASLEDQLAERLGLSPDSADPAGFSQQMAKIYNNLGLKMMERRKHDEAMGLLRKAEAVVDNDAAWQGGPVAAARRQRMRAITYNNLGCLFKRRNLPQLALQYLQKALALEEAGGPVQNSSSTHLNICAAFSALKRPKEALGHAECAIILLQRDLWGAHFAAPFQDGLGMLVRQLHPPAPAAGAAAAAAAGAAAASATATRHLLASSNLLAMAYHNAGVEHEKLGRLREALVSFTRAYLIASKCLGAKAQMTAALSRALKAFQQRQARHLPTGVAHAVRKAPSTMASGRAAAAAAQSKRGLRSGKASAGSKASGSLASKGGLAAAAASGKATLPLDKGRTSSGSSMAGVRPPSSSRLATQLQQTQPQP